MCSMGEERTVLTTPANAPADQYWPYVRGCGEDAMSSIDLCSFAAFRASNARRAQWKPPNWTDTQAPTPIKGVRVPL